MAVTETDEEERAQTVETAADDDDSETGVEMTAITRRSRTQQYDAQDTPLPARYKALSEAKTLSESDEIDDHHEEKGLSGAQDAAIAGACRHRARVLFCCLGWPAALMPAGKMGKITLHCCL